MIGLGHQPIVQEFLRGFFQLEGYEVDHSYELVELQEKDHVQRGMHNYFCCEVDASNPLSVLFKYFGVVLTGEHEDCSEELEGDASHEVDHDHSQQPNAK